MDKRCPLCHWTPGSFGNHDPDCPDQVPVHKRPQALIDFKKGQGDGVAGIDPQSNGTDSYILGWVIGRTSAVVAEEQEDQDPTLKLQHQILEAHAQNRLPELIGKALGKTAVVIIMVDAEGGVLITANCRSNQDDVYVRDRSMITQTSDLLAANMKNMMKIAGEESKKPKS